MTKMEVQTFGSYMCKIRGAAAVSVAAVALMLPGATLAQSQTTIQEQYIPTIWVDPDGCEHWVMDDGAEGFMTPHVTRDGKPVCRHGAVCGVVPTDEMFATDSAVLSSAGRARLAEFFREANAQSFVIAGHTDSRASDAYNLDLSTRRAHSVAQIAANAGVRVAEVRGYGERQPTASNATSSGQAKNRRVEIICVR